MNTIFNKLPYYKKKCFFLIIILLLSGNSIAQQVAGPFYTIPASPPLQQIYSYVHPFEFYGISMNEVSAFDNSIYDGIMLNFTMYMDTDNSIHTTTLVSFSDDDLNNGNLPIIRIYYKKPSLFIRRYYADNLSKYYDYMVYDNLYTSTTFYEIKLYVTANFIFIVTNNTTNEYFLSPIFFGLNLLPYSYSMTKFLNRSNKAFIGIGSIGDDAPYISYVKLYAFSYNRKTGTDTQGKPIYEGLLPNIRAWIKQLYVN
jgi:hypothetical protein